MIATLKRFQNIIIAVVLIAVAFFVYSYFFAPSKELALSKQEVSQGTPVDQDLIALLLTLRSIKLDASIFADPTFLSLQDFSKDLIPEPVGRPNPFAPLGGRQTTIGL